MNEDQSDIIIEVLEIFLNKILYIRELYPRQIFEKRKVYNVPVYISIYPPLNEYILGVLKSAKELNDNKKLQRFEIQIYKDDMKIYESYIFEIDDLNPIVNEKSDDEYLIDFEENIRKSLMTLDDRVKILGDLPKNAKFKIHLHTSQSAFVKLSNNPEFQEFLWLQEKENSQSVRNKISILPVTYINSCGIQIYAEQDSSN